MEGKLSPSLDETLCIETTLELYYAMCNIVTVSQLAAMAKPWAMVPAIMSLAAKE